MIGFLVGFGWSFGYSSGMALFRIGGFVVVSSRVFACLDYVLSPALALSPASGGRLYANHPPYPPPGLVTEERRLHGLPNATFVSAAIWETQLARLARLRVPGVLHHQGRRMGSTLG